MAAAPSSASAASAKRASYESMSSVSTTSLIFDRIGERAAAEKEAGKLRGGGRSNVSYNDDREERENAIKDEEDDGDERDDYDLETGPFLGGGRGGAGGEGNRTDGRGEGREGGSRGTASAGLVGSGSGSDGYKKMDRSFRKIVMGVTLAVVMAWVLGLFVYVSNRSYRHGSEQEHDPLATATRGSLRPITRAQIDAGLWAPRRATIHWIEGPGGEDGQLVETAGAGKDYLVIEDVRAMGGGTGGATAAQKSRTLVKTATFSYGGQTYSIDSAVPCRDMSKVLLGVDTESNWRHSSTAAYFVLDVASQTVQALIPGDAGARVQLALWSPTNDAVAFTRDNNLFLRGMAASEDAVAVRKVTADGGADLFYGVPDWVYEEEVFSGSSATWWAPSGQHVAFLRTNETGVPSYPVQYFMERPSGSAPPAAGEENYPEVQQIKYPKAGAHNPVVELLFCDTTLGQVFEVEWPGAAAGTAGFADNDRLITTVLWLGPQKVLVKETNRVSNVMRVVVVDVAARKATVVRTVDVGKLDGGWFEISQRTRFVPADAARQRPHDGYIDTVIYNDGDHLAYFSPPENPEPVMLTRGPNWEVVDAPAAVDLQRNLVYFLGTKDGSTQRHLYSVTLTGGGAGEATAVTNTSAPGFYSASFSTGAGFVLLEYRGPGIPWQKVVSTPASASSASSSFEHVLADNAELAERARKHALPLLVYGTIEVDGVELNYVERRPPHFDGSGRTQYPVLFQQYSGPGSQEVRHEFRVDFQAYVAARLGYVVVTVDPRGTGFRGRAHRVVVRGRLGLAESHDHIGAARNWAARPYVDAARLAIWGWSYGGFTTLKTLEQDAGRTFRYGMAVAPVTDWRFYDSVYTERYMDTPQANAAGYDASAVRNASALGQNVRFLLMHGVADDNVHMQNSLALIDRLDLAGVSNYDVHVFPDSDHGIYFHNAHQIVYDKLENWLINAFNGEWLKVDHAKPTGKR